MNVYCNMVTIHSEGGGEAELSELYQERCPESSLSLQNSISDFLARSTGTIKSCFFFLPIFIVNFGIEFHTYDL